MNKKKILLWVARVWSILSLGTILVIFLGHIFAPEDDIGTGVWEINDIIAAFFYPAGTSIGMIVSWLKKRERLGAFITLGSLIGFAIIILIPRNAFGMFPMLILLGGGGPAILFLIYSFMRNNKK